MMAKDHPCPDCGFSEGGQAPAYNLEVMTEFAKRHKEHSRNFGISMLLRFIAGFVAMVTAGLWFFVIFRGSIFALILVGLLSVVSAILGAAVFLAEKWFPTALHCPSCELRLDKLGGSGNECPQCQAKLRGTVEDLKAAYGANDVSEPTDEEFTVEQTEEEPELVSV